MSKLHGIELIAQLFLLKSGLFAAFLRSLGHNRFSGEPPPRRQSPGPDPWALVALADQEAAAGRHNQAKCLLEAAYIAFDNQL
ncbi:MAG TPA: hypothetical protein PLD10_07685 [Rhodopila sp.]|nr:hypothetical protein [Rhodopila sp.]